MPRKLTKKRPCAFPGCGKFACSRGLCHSHYCQWLEGKQLTAIEPRRPRGSPPVITTVKIPCPVAGLEGPCLIFTGRKTKGYGRVTIGRCEILVHRYVWEQVHGPIPSWLEIDHQCRTKACCNINHLRLVKHQTNTTENVEGSHWQINLAKTHCPRGHEYTPENTRSRPDKGRDCKLCALLRAHLRWVRDKIRKR